MHAVNKYLLLVVLFASCAMAAQNVPLGEAIRNRNVQIYQGLKLDALPSPADQGASKKQFFEGHWHGLELIRLSRELRQEYDIPNDIQGLLIDEVTLEATECGFLAGDVVQRVAGYPILTLKEFLKASMKVQNETSVKIEIYRSSHAQALSGDIAINDLRKRADVLNAPQNSRTMTLVLRIADYYNNLGYANMDAAPPIQPGAISPHKDRGRKCTDCHVFMNTGGQLAVDAGDLVPNPPKIIQGAPCPHEARGQCNFCHRIIKPDDTTGTLTEANSPTGAATLRSSAPPIQPGAICPHVERGRCVNCHVFMNAGNPPPISQASPCPHQTRGTCNLCHQIIADPRGKTAAAVNPLAPPIPPGAVCVHEYRGQCINCHVFINAGNPPPISQASPCPHQTKGTCSLCHQIISNPSGAAVGFTDTMPAVIPNSQSPDEALRNGQSSSPALLPGRIDTNALPMMQENGKPASQSNLQKQARYRKGTMDRNLSTRTMGILVILAFIYFLIFNNILGRTVSFPLGALLVLVLGYKFDFYTVTQALGSINFNLLMFIIGMNLIFSIFLEALFFENIAGRIAIKSNGNKTTLFVFLCLLTFVAAALLDTMAIILVVVPLTLRLAKGLHFDPKPFVIGVIISSNLGGAATMIGDIPNLLIALSTNLRFMDFIVYEAPACVLLLCAMFAYMRFSHGSFFASPVSMNELNENPEFDSFRWIKPISNPTSINQALIILGIVVIGIIFASQFAGIFAIIGGLIILLIGGIPRKNIIKHVGWGDVIFFTSLFIIVGAFEASGVLYYVAHAVVLNLTGGNILAIAIMVMVISSVITAFMNAGPTTAVFIPMIIHLGIQAPDNLIWWALSLGVLCGSSASLYGATGGPLASSIVAKYWKKRRKQIEGPLPASFSKILDMREYLVTGLPIGGIFLVISIGYISILYFYFQIR